MSHPFEAGFVLASLLAEQSASDALPSLAPGLRARLARYDGAVRATIDSDRVRVLRRLAADAKHVEIDGRREPRRVLAAIATDVPKEKGAAWIAAVPRHRAGWSVPQGLKQTLLRNVGPEEGERARHEIAELDAAWPA